MTLSLSPAPASFSQGAPGRRGGSSSNPCQRLVRARPQTCSPGTAVGPGKDVGSRPCPDANPGRVPRGTWSSTGWGQASRGAQGDGRLLKWVKCQEGGGCAWRPWTGAGGRGPAPARRHGVTVVMAAAQGELRGLVAGEDRFCQGGQGAVEGLGLRGALGSPEDDGSLRRMTPGGR